MDRVGNAMRQKGWFIRQRDNQLVHIVLTPPHEHVVDELLADLRQAVGAATS